MCKSNLEVGKGPWPCVPHKVSSLPSISPASHRAMTYLGVLAMPGNVEATWKRP